MIQNTLKVFDAFLKEPNMHKKLDLAVVLAAFVLFAILLPACSKNTTPAADMSAQMQQQDLEEQKVREQLEKERQMREEQKSELRAQMIKFMYEDIYFEKGSYQLTPEARKLLLAKSQWLLKHPDIKVIIEGHTDEPGSKEHNLALGDRRAGAVKSFLIGQGVESARLIVVSYGNEKPIDAARTEKAGSKNRRVHFVVEK
jgi:peptidoglycan-associated lipoprotein